MSEIEEAVKKAIERQIGDEGIVAQDGYSVKVDAWLDLDVIARAAIEAYEAAKREELHRALMNTSRQLSPAVFDDYTASQNIRYGTAEKTTPLDAAYLSAVMRAGFKP